MSLRGPIRFSHVILFLEIRLGSPVVLRAMGVLGGRARSLAFRDQVLILRHDVMQSIVDFILEERMGDSILVVGHGGDRGFAGNGVVSVVHAFIASVHGEVHVSEFIGVVSGE